MKRVLMGSAALFVLPFAAFANCPAITVADMGGVAAGAYPAQYELADFQAAANCTMALSENPAIAEFNGKIRGNPALPAVADRLPAEPLVVVAGHCCGMPLRLR